MIATILAALGIGYSNSRIASPGQQPMRRVRWRGSDGRWYWQAA